MHPDTTAPNLLTRRQIIRQTLGASTGVLLASPLNAFNKVTGIKNKTGVGACSVRHGRPKGDDFMVWSLMKTTNTDQVNNSIANIRNSTGYLPKISYSGNDKYKITACKEVINSVASQNHITFKILVFKNYSDYVKGLSKQKFNEKIINAYKRVSDTDFSSVQVKAEDNWGPSLTFNNQLQAIGGFRLEATKNNHSELLQINDLMSGCIYALISGKEVKSKTKLEILEHFKKVYGISKDVPSSFGNFKYIESVKF